MASKKRKDSDLGKEKEMKPVANISKREAIRPNDGLKKINIDSLIRTIRGRK